MAANGLENYFQQNNDAKHTTTNSQLFLLFNTPRQLKTAQSPDLKPIEHLWDYLELRFTVINSKVQLTSHLLAELSAIFVDYAVKLVQSI